ncbi:MAG: hypothetical protein LBH59_00480 [Planctomycetaceae bacterium]|jgi:hypothetical protein|nr:hypothetical protein [Planctomycetaceae bacterium]
MTKNSNNNDINLQDVTVDSLDKSKLKSKYTSWHRGLFGALDFQYRRIGCDKLKFTQEYQSISRSYSIDVLITQETPPPTNNSNALGLVKCLGRFTLCEFKSPYKSLSTRDIDRQTLLCLQYYLEDKDIDRNDMASMFVIYHYPRKIFDNLPKDWVVEKIEQGIYTIRNNGINTSIVVIPELREDLYEWLTSTQLDLPTPKLEKILNELEKYHNDHALGLLRDLLIEINIEKFNEGEPMTNKLLKIIKRSAIGTIMANEYIAIGEAKGEAIGEAKGKAESIIRILTRRIDKPSARLQKKIREVHNLNSLDELIDFASTCVSLDEFATAFN